jgi:hypothetical protein
LIQHGVNEEFPQVQADFGKALAKARDTVLEPAHNGRGHKTDGQPSMLASRCPLRGAAGVSHLIECVLRFFVEDSARSCQFHAAARTVKKLDSQVPFQLPNTLAQRWLCKVERLSRMAEVHFPGNGNEMV